MASCEVWIVIIPLLLHLVEGVSSSPICFTLANASVSGVLPRHPTANSDCSTGPFLFHFRYIALVEDRTLQNNLSPSDSPMSYTASERCKTGT